MTITHTKSNLFLLVVPVFDARVVPFDINKDIECMHEILPAFNDKLPQGSFVVVGYSASTYKGKQDKMNLSCNVQWVVVVGTPE